MECTPEGAQMASPQGLRTPSKISGTSCLNESPQQPSKKLTPKKRLNSDSGLLDSASGAALRLVIFFIN